MEGPEVRSDATVAARTRGGLSVVGWRSLLMSVPISRLNGRELLARNTEEIVKPERIRSARLDLASAFHGDPKTPATTTLCLWSKAERARSARSSKGETETEKKFPTLSSHRGGCLKLSIRVQYRSR
jgi:hypothetical protein